MSWNQRSFFFLLFASQAQARDLDLVIPRQTPECKAKARAVIETFAKVPALSSLRIHLHEVELDMQRDVDHICGTNPGVENGVICKRWALEKFLPNLTPNSRVMLLLPRLGYFKNYPSQILGTSFPDSTYGGPKGKIALLFCEAYPAAAVHEFLHMLGFCDEYSVFLSKQEVLNDLICPSGNQESTYKCLNYKMVKRDKLTFDSERECKEAVTKKAATWKKLFSWWDSVADKSSLCASDAGFQGYVLMSEANSRGTGLHKLPVCEGRVVNSLAIAPHAAQPETVMSNAGSLFIPEDWIPLIKRELGQ